MMIFWVGILLLWIFWLVMIIDITKRDWKNAGDRAAYLVLVIFMNIIGALIYYFAVKRHLDNKKK
jgi:drug/metabolite transporter (DMT)-like permease